MTSGSLALTITVAIVAIGAAIGLSAGLSRKMDLEQWSVGGRGFGPVLIYLLMAGEIYTTFSFLGASGWAYSRGGPTLYILAYLTLAFVVSFFIMPPLWELGHRHGLQTQADFFALRYGNKYLGAFVGLLGIIFMIPYLQLQLTGLGIIVSVTSFDTIGRTPAVVASVALLTVFVFVGGIRAVAWVSVLKDLMILCAALSIGIAVPYAHYGGVGAMFTALAKSHPHHLTMPGATSNLGHSWYVSTVLLTSFGCYMWPHAFGASFTAKSADTLRRNTVIMPIYGIFLAFVLFVGFTSVLVVPGLSNGDLSLLTVVRRSFPPWFLGFIGGAGALTAIVPAAILLLTSATLFSKNLVRTLLAPDMADHQIARLARVSVVVLSVITLYLAILSSTTLVSLLLVGYAGVTQFFPGVVLGLFWKRATARGVFWGLLCGEVTAALLMLTGRDPFHGVSAGFIALCLNFLIASAVSISSSTQIAEPAEAQLLAAQDEISVVQANL
jgi:solute:Na+ symporter, SSS family